jgi:hypothetical protein
VTYITKLATAMMSMNLLLVHDQTVILCRDRQFWFWIAAESTFINHTLGKFKSLQALVSMIVRSDLLTLNAVLRNLLPPPAA